MPDGRPVDLYILTNAHGLRAAITNFGGILVSLETPDRNGKLGDIVLGLDTFPEYLAVKRYYGATVGRYANRIGKARFTLDGIEYTLARNNGENSLHGGVVGFHKKLWSAREISDDGLELTYVSPDGEEGFPGKLTAKVTYTLTANDELRIDYAATTDKATVVNFTNHSFFNLAGGGDILQEIVRIDADRYTPVDAGLIPTGELRSVAGTPFDFRKPVEIGKPIHDDDPQLKFARGYDHNWVLNHPSGELGFAASVYDPKSGRTMDVLTTEPGIQFYTGNTLDGTGKQGQAYGPYSALCLETQHFPDSPNRPEFPSTVLRPGQKFHSTTIYRFGHR